MKKKLAMVLICGFLCLIIILVLVKDNTNVDENVNVGNEWLKQVSKNEYTITVLSQTDCDYCIEYKPIIEKYTKDNDMKLYYFELDELDDDTIRIFVNTYEFDMMGTPHTLITKDGLLINDFRGSKIESELDEILSDL